MQCRIIGTREHRTVERDREHLLGAHALFLHAARRDDDGIAERESIAAG